MPVPWTPISEVTVGPDDLSVVVGSFDLDQGDDTIWVDVVALNADDFWPWSYGILSWKTDRGYELGSTKAYTEKPGEIFRLGVGRPPRLRSGVLIYEPRSFNLSWIKKGNELTLSFTASSGRSGGGDGNTGGSSSVAFPVVDANWRYASASGLLQLKF